MLINGKVALWIILAHLKIAWGLITPNSSLLCRFCYYPYLQHIVRFLAYLAVSKQLKGVGRFVPKDNTTTVVQASVGRVTFLVKQVNKYARTLVVLITISKAKKNCANRTNITKGPLKNADHVASPAAWVPNSANKWAAQSSSCKLQQSIVLAQHRLRGIGIWNMLALL